MDLLELLVVESGGAIMAATSKDGVHWWHSHAETPGFVNTGHTTQNTPGLVAVTSPGNPGNGNFYMAMLGQTNNDLFWRGSGDGVGWSGGAINQQTKFPPSLMMYYNAQNSGVGPYVGFVANNSTNEVLVASTPFWGDPWPGTNTPINQTSQCAPAFTGCIDYFVMLFVSNDSSNRLLACNTNGNTPGPNYWSGATNTGQSSKAAPSVTGLGSNLVMAFLSNDSNNNILISTSPDGVQWSGATATGHQSRTAPCITNSGGELFIAFIGLNTGDVRLISSSNGTNWSSSVTAGINSPVAPAIAGFNFQLTFSLNR